MHTQENTMDKLIRKLIESEPTVSLTIDDAPDVWIAPAILDNGKLEYQVSDGPVGQRGMSWDVYSWDEAKSTALEMQDKLDKEK
jgi:hypothetical protein